MALKLAILTSQNFKYSTPIMLILVLFQRFVIMAWNNMGCKLYGHMEHGTCIFGIYFYFTFIGLFWTGFGLNWFGYSVNK